MMILQDITLSLEISSFIILGVVILAVLLLFLLTKFKVLNYEIDGAEIGLSGPSIHICGKKSVRQIAYKIWVEINTRVIGVKIDFEQDIIRAIHESYYAFFKGVRELIKEIKVSNVVESKELIDLTMNFLNIVMRPYLTKWGLRFNEWYDRNSPSSEKSPLQLQKLFPEYDKLMSDLADLNEKVIVYSKKLNEIAFGLRKKRNRR